MLSALFGIVAWRGFRIALRARDPFGRYLAMGLSITIGVQAMTNMMVGLKMLPPKGMVLPFLSYGGSSLILHLAAVGVLMNISMKGAEAVVAQDDRRRRWDRQPVGRRTWQGQSDRPPCPRSRREPRRDPSRVQSAARSR